MLQQILKRIEADAFLFQQSEATHQRCGYEISKMIETLSGFSGSTALLIMGRNSQAIFVDPRYTLQAQKECGDRFEVIECSSLNPKFIKIQTWIQDHFFSSQSPQNPCCTFAYDPYNITALQYQTLQAHYPKIQWVPFPLDVAQKKGGMESYDILYSGKTFLEKKASFLSAFEAFRDEPLGFQDAILLTSPESIAWLFNIRAIEFEYTPISPSLALWTKGQTFLWGDGGFSFEIDPEVTLKSVPFERFGEELVQTLNCCHVKKLFYNPTQISQALKIELQKRDLSLVAVREGFEDLGCIKNAAEIQNSKEIHQTEAKALIQLFAWIHHTREPLTEYAVTEKLESLRRENPDYRGPSFKSIVAFGTNAAMIHYSPSAIESSEIQSGLLLIDVGGQYWGGTTDMTRTLWVGKGEPSSKMKAMYTRVLKGNIALAEAIFPEGLTGSQLDPLARQYLWQVGEDYPHGTGHGVGNYLAVHEGSVSIAPRGTAQPLKEGMILSNEPGFYQAGAFGIRLENLMSIEKKIFPEGGCGLRFEMLTYVPFEARLIDWSLVTDLEKKWLKKYHEKTLQIFSERGEGSALKWLQEAVHDFLT